MQVQLLHRSLDLETSKSKFVSGNFGFHKWLESDFWISSADSIRKAVVDTGDVGDVHVKA